MLAPKHPVGAEPALIEGEDAHQVSVAFLRRLVALPPPHRMAAAIQHLPLEHRTV
jgi:hypothetical protein